MNVQLDEKEIFRVARSVHGASQRKSYLDLACGDNSSLRERVESLLAAHESVGDYLARAPVDDLDRHFQLAGMGPGSIVGRYKILEQIGEGGFGVVYMADQLEPVQRRVALKIIKAGMDSKQVIARFEAERQALALMEHPNVAQVLDAGSTEMGRPYFVMDLVRGIPVTEYCDQHCLSTEERLLVFMDVCSAIQHAHQKGIIHRDIKPSNILVATNGDRPVAKIIDFGIAKATQGRLTDKTLFTQFRQFMGTPAYTSPEQAQMSAVDVDTRSDVYSLGVLLYELLTGETPLDMHELRDAEFDEVCRRIREEEPLRPSTRVSNLMMEERTTVARHRRTEPMNLQHKIRGDLDWIVMKALEKDRARRYETADSLKLDVERFLANEPVSAVAPTTTYKMSKFVRRNRNALAVAGIVVTLLAVGSVISIWQAIRATAAEQDARMHSNQASELRKRAEASERNARRREYAAEMIVAQRGFGELNSKNTWELLQRHVPGPNQLDFRGFEWRSLWNANSRELFTLVGHTDEMRSIAFSPDGDWLASGSTDGTARLWNVQTRREVWQYPGGGHCNRVAFTPDGQWLLTAFHQGENTLWDVSDPGNPKKIRDLGVSGVFAPDGITLVGGRSLLKQRSLTGEILREYIDPSLDASVSGERTHLGDVRSWAFSPDGHRLVTAGGDSKVGIWDTETAERVLTLRGDTTNVMGVSFSPTDDELIVTVSLTGAFRVWDGAGSELHWTQLQNEQLEHVEFSKDGKSAVVSERFGALRVFDTETWTETSAFDSRGVGNLLKCSPRYANVAVTAGADGAIRFWDISPTNSILDHPSPVRSLEFSPDGRILAVGMANGVAQFWDLANKSKIFATPATATVDPYTHRPPSLNPIKPGFVAFSPDSNKAAIIGPEKTVTVWDLQTKDEEAVMNTPLEEETFGSVVFSASGTELYTGTLWGKGENGVLIWNWKEPAAPVTKLDHPGAWGVFCMAISPDGTKLASGHSDVRLWSVPQRLLLRSLPLSGVTDMERGVLSLRFSPDGNWLAVGDAADSVWLWDTRSWKHELLTLRLNVSSIDFSPEGDRLVAADISGMTKLWDLETRRAVATYHGSVADFSPDGTILAIGREDILSSHSMPAAGRVRLYYAPPLAEIDRDLQKADR